MLENENNIAPTKNQILRYMAIYDVSNKRTEAYSQNVSRFCSELVFIIFVTSTLKLFKIVQASPWNNQYLCNVK